MNVQERMERKLREGLEVIHLEVENESNQHNVPTGSESHFKVVVVSPSFEGRNLVARHREVYRLLGEELRTGVHCACPAYLYRSGLARGGYQRPRLPPVSGRNGEGEQRSSGAIAFRRGAAAQAPR